MPGSVFAKLPYAFPNAHVDSWKQIQSNVSQLSGFEPVTYHCCVNSCCCFVGTHADATECPYCKTSRLDANGKPRQVFVYLPVIPRLKAFLANVRMARKMQYRANEHQHNPDIIADVFDAAVYQALLKKTVCIDGKTLDHQYFADSRDVALGLSTDGFAPFRRRTKTAWPLILFNYNLPPEIRFHLENILSLGVIPGPKKPVDFDSFLWPFVQEMLQLSVGVHAYDSLTDEFFALRAYLILVFGDIPAISMVMSMKGHNGLRPCRMCNIRGIRTPNSRNPVHYVPLDRSRHPDVHNSSAQVPTYDAENLPLRSHDSFLAQAKEVQFAPTAAESDRLAKDYGIKGIPVLSVLPSLSFPLSFPYDFMHLLWENVIKNLMQLWTGEYKGLNEGSEEYQLEPSVWDAIGAASSAAGSTIPYAFGPRPPNVSTDKVSWTADTRSFWALYVGPVLLSHRFKKRKYYDHFVELVRLLHVCLQFEVSREEVQQVRAGLIQWVRDYERYVIPLLPERMIVNVSCIVTVSTISMTLNGSLLARSPSMLSYISPIASLLPVLCGPHGPFLWSDIAVLYSLLSEAGGIPLPASIAMSSTRPVLTTSSSNTLLTKS